VGNIAKRNNGKWLARYRDDMGQERSKQFDRKADGQRWLAEITTSMATGTYVDPAGGKLTFREPTSLANYEATLRLNVYPRIGGRPLAAIRPTEIAGMIAWMREKPLAPRTIRVAMAVTSSVFKAAMLDRRIAVNPCAGVKLPEVHKPRLDILTTEQVLALTDAVPPEWRAALVLGAGTGVRAGEMAGLTVDRVNFLRRQVTIDRQLLALPKREPFLAPPKTKASVRNIPAPQVVIDALAEHLERFGTHDDGLFFEPMFRSLFSSRVWRPAVKAAGVPATTSYHDLRHYYASLLIRHGESVKTVQARLGHSSAVITLDTYTGLWPDSEDQTRAAVDSVLGAYGRAAVRGDSADQTRTSGGPAT